jgi:ABC-2 type transport system ATP-binding protein
MTNLAPAPMPVTTPQPAPPPGRAAPALEIEGLVKTYKGKRAVDGLSLVVRPGEIVGFLGPNGSGKTTTMRCAVGLARPDAGRIRVFGAEPGAPEALAQIGSMIEEPALYADLSGRDHLRVAASWCGLAGVDVDGLLARVGLAGAGRKPCGKYSLGMKQRLALATALLGDPPLLILDEPSNGLDPAGIRDIRKLLDALRAEGRAVLLSSHMLGEVEQLADRLVIIREGRPVFEGTVTGVLGATGEPRLADAFLALSDPAVPTGA